MLFMLRPLFIVVLHILRNFIEAVGCMFSAAFDSIFKQFLGNCQEFEEECTNRFSPFLSLHVTMILPSNI